MDDASERLLAQIRASPDSDAPRQVYADLLSSRGHLRGEYITLALRAARNELSAEQQRRYLELDRMSYRWARELGCQDLGVLKWRRGFPECVCAGGWDGPRLARLLQRVPVRELILDGRDGAKLADLPELAWIESLTLARDVELEDAVALARSRHWRSLRTLVLKPRAMSERHASTIASAWRALIEDLSLMVPSLPEAACMALFADAWPRLHSLRTWKTPIGDLGARTIAACELPALSRLVVGEAEVTAAGARALFETPNLPSVAALELVRNRLTGSLESLGRSAFTSQLRDLRLEECGLQAPDATALARTHLPLLARLELAGNPIGDSGSAALATSGTLPRVEYVNLQRTGLTREGVVAFTRTTLEALRILEVSDNPLPSGERVDHEMYDWGTFLTGVVTVEIPYRLADVRSWFTEARSAIEIR